MKKKYGGLFCLIFICCIFLIACNSVGKQEAKLKVDDEDNFVTYDGQLMTSTPEGYYFNQSGFLYFVTPDFSESTIVCDDLECVHNEKRDNHMDYHECDAYFGMQFRIDYYDGFLYIIGDNPSNMRKQALYKVSMDGNDKTIIYDDLQGVRGMYLYDGVVYTGEERYTENDKIHWVKSIPVDNPKESKLIYETKEHPTRTLNQFECGHGYCDFYLYDPAILEEDSLYIRINLETGESEEVYKPSVVRIERGDGMNMMQVMDIQSYDPLVWTEEYFSFREDIDEKVKLMKEDFGSIGTRDLLRDMDDEYIYFISINNGEDTVPIEEQKIRIYDYEGVKKAEISVADLGIQYYILPGTEDYMFIMVQVITTDMRIPFEFYYVDKSEFDGGTVEAHRIHITK